MKDPYLYEDINVLVNKNHIKDQKILDEFENRMSNLSLVSLFKNGMKIQSVLDIYAIHKNLFLYVYDWAGLSRTIDMSKSEPILNGMSVVYTHFKDIKKQLSSINQKYMSLNWKELSKEIFVHKLTRLLTEIWKVHPFREGNTRVVSAFGFLFLKQYGYSYNVELIKKHAKYFRNALVMSSLNEYAEYDYIDNIMKDAIFHIDSKNVTTKYQRIKNYNIENYEYTYHEVE